MKQYMFKFLICESLCDAISVKAHYNFSRWPNLVPNQSHYNWRIQFAQSKTRGPKVQLSLIILNMFRLNYIFGPSVIIIVQFWSPCFNWTIWSPKYHNCAFTLRFQLCYFGPQMSRLFYFSSQDIPIVTIGSFVTLLFLTPRTYVTHVGLIWHWVRSHVLSVKNNTMTKWPDCNN